jgi:hypothetical protein
MIAHRVSFDRMPNQVPGRDWLPGGGDQESAHLENGHSPRVVTFLGLLKVCARSISQAEGVPGWAVFGLKCSGRRSFTGAPRKFFG